MSRTAWHGRKGLLVVGVAAHATPRQIASVDTALQLLGRGSDWLEILDARGSGVAEIARRVSRIDHGLIGLPVFDAAHLEWAAELSRVLKNEDRETRTAVIVSGCVQDLPPIIRSWPAFDVAVAFDPVIMITDLRETDARYSHWRLAGYSFFDTLLRLVDREPLEQIGGIAYRTEDGEVCSRECYRPRMFGDAYYDDWTELVHVGTADIAEAKRRRANLAYSELAESGAAKLFGGAYCDAHHASALYDLGMGTGRLAMQAFATCPSLQRTVGVELSRERYLVGAAAARKFASENGYTLTERADRVEVRDAASQRTLEFIHGDFLDVPAEDLGRAQVVILWTEILDTDRLDGLIGALSPGARLVSGRDLSQRPQAGLRPVSQIRPYNDGFATSSSPNHYLYVFLRIGSAFHGPGGAPRSGKMLSQA